MAKHCPSSPSFLLPAYHTASNIRWLGLRSIQLDILQLPPEAREPLSARDMRVLNSLRNQQLFRVDPELERELVFMERGKVELQALFYFGLDYLSSVFLPNLLFSRNGDETTVCHFV
mmetsp:Transcript_16301/g.33105  ORF Transcript_16301/g.33105 Transcript_16301/m.33105 type:complete len:117 (-) Transcript_16301:1288-1638(-)